MAKPKPRKIVRELLDYNDSVDWIEEKYGVKVRDFAGKFAKENVNKKDKDRPPYLDFWHWLIDRYQINNGSILNMRVDYENKEHPEWVNKILKMFHDEFKTDLVDGELQFEVNW